MKKIKKAYSILIALLIIGFLLILSSWVFQMLLRELNDNRGRADYLKAYYAAESWIEWALLDIKENTYGYIDTLKFDKNDPRSRVLGKYPEDKNRFNGRRDVLVSYTIDTKTQNSSWSLSPWEHLMLPLYYIDHTGWYDTADISLEINSHKQESIIWNIVGEEFGLAWSWSFNMRTEAHCKKTDSSWFLSFSKKNVTDFLNESKKNYLILFNTDWVETIDYEIKSSWDNFFTEAKGNIYSSAMVGESRQNIMLSLDNTAFLSILKYSIFSP